MQILWDMTRELHDLTAVGFMVLTALLQILKQSPVEIWFLFLTAFCFFLSQVKFLKSLFEILHSIRIKSKNEMTKNKHVSTVLQH